MCECLEEQVKEFVQIIGNINEDKHRLQCQQVEDMEEIEVVTQQFKSLELQNKETCENIQQQSKSAINQDN